MKYKMLGWYNGTTYLWLMPGKLPLDKEYSRCKKKDKEIEVSDGDRGTAGLERCGRASGDDLRSIQKTQWSSKRDKGSEEDDKRRGLH
jgi:hypothetical protein